MSRPRGLFQGYTFNIPTQDNPRWSRHDWTKLNGLIRDLGGEVGTRFPTFILAIGDTSRSSRFLHNLRQGSWRSVPVLDTGWAWACWRAGRILGHAENWGGFRLDLDPRFLDGSAASRRMVDNDGRAPLPVRSSGADSWRRPPDWPMSSFFEAVSDDPRKRGSRGGSPPKQHDLPSERSSSPAVPVSRCSSPQQLSEKEYVGPPVRAHLPATVTHLPGRPMPIRTVSAPVSGSSLSTCPADVPLVRHKLPVSVYDPERDPRRRALASNALRISVTSPSFPPLGVEAAIPTPVSAPPGKMAFASKTDRPQTSPTPLSPLTPLSAKSALCNTPTTAPSDAGSSASRRSDVTAKSSSRQSRSPAEAGPARLLVDSNGNPLWFAVHGAAEDQQSLGDTITQAGGLVLEEEKQSRARYHVFRTDERCVIPSEAVESLAALRQIKGTRALTVSSCWIDQCVKDGKLFNPEPYALQYAPASFPVPRVCVPRKRKAEVGMKMEMPASPSSTSRGDSDCRDTPQETPAAAVAPAEPLEAVGGTTGEDETVGETVADAVSPVLVSASKAELEPGPVLSLEEVDDDYDDADLDALNSDSEEGPDDGICVILEEEYERSAFAKHARAIAEMGGVV